jgi:hypothetical protein
MPLLRLHVGKIEGFPDPPEAENPFKRNGGKAGNRTLDPGIMSALPFRPRLNLDPIEDPKSLI